jgi:hypothetical protein
MSTSRVAELVVIEATFSSVLEDLRNILQNREKQLSIVGKTYY